MIWQVFAFIGTLAAYVLSRALHSRASPTIQRNIPPLLIGLLLTAAVQYGGRIPWQSFKTGTDPLVWSLAPVVVALVIPLSQSKRLLSNFRPIALAVASGIAANIGVTLVVCYCFHIKPEVTASLMPKTSSSGIAIQIANASGGVPGMAAAFSVLCGLMGSWLYPILAPRWRGQPTSLGIAVGTVSHGIGTSRLASEAKTDADHEATGASAFAMPLAGIITALLLLPWML